MIVEQFFKLDNNGEKTVKCPDCGRALSLDDIFCSDCGTPLYDDADLSEFDYMESDSLSGELLVDSCGFTVNRDLDNEEDYE